MKRISTGNKYSNKWWVICKNSVEWRKKKGLVLSKEKILCYSALDAESVSRGVLLYAHKATGDREKAEYKNLLLNDKKCVIIFFVKRNKIPINQLLQTKNTLLRCLKK